MNVLYSPHVLYILCMLLQLLLTMGPKGIENILLPTSLMSKGALNTESNQLRVVGLKWASELAMATGPR